MPRSVDLFSDSFEYSDYLDYIEYIEMSMGIEGNSEVVKNREAKREAILESRSREISERQNDTHDVEKQRDLLELDRTLPLNWSTMKKFYNMGVPSLLCFVV